MTSLFATEHLNRLGKRAADPLFGPAVKRLRREVEAFLAAGFSVPDLPAGFYHNYFCPDHAVELLFDPSKPTAHRCPRDGRIFTDPAFDAAWRWFVNNRLSTMAFSVAVLFHVDGEPQHLNAVRDILKGYAARYLGYEPETHTSSGVGKATFQSLDEAVWLIPLVRAYDLVKDALGQQVRKDVEQNLLRPAAAHILSQKFHRIHNIENWHNTALAAVGFCLDDATLVQAAVEDKFGFHHQLADGVRDDGLWWEGSSSYHFYALAALTAHAQISSGSGIELWKNARFEKMFRTPVDLVLPDMRLPATNDCWFFSSLLGDVCHGVAPASGFYEIAHGWYDDHAFAWVLEQNYRCRKRDSLEALLYGRDRLRSASQVSFTGVNCEASGLLLLRSPAPLDAQDSLLLKYGPHGGGHGHPDKLSVFLYAGGDAVGPDLGTPGYGVELNDSWYRQTISHNTVIVDGRSQPEADGQLVAFEPGGDCGFDVADARVEWEEGTPYAGVSLRRVILWAPEYYIDFAHLCSDRKRQIDWCFRVNGSLIAANGFTGGERTEGPDGDGYQHVADTRAYRADGPARMQWRLKRGRMTLHLPDEGDTTILRGQVPSNPADEMSDILIRRRHGPETTFICVVQTADRPAFEVAPLPSSMAPACGVAVTIDGQLHLWLLCSPESQPVTSFPGAILHTYQL